MYSLTVPTVGGQLTFLCPCWLYMRPVNLHPLFLKIGHHAFWKSGTLFFEKNRVQKTKVIVIQKENRQPGLFSFWIENDLFFSASFLQKAGCPIFQKAGCPIFKNSGCKLTGRVLQWFSKLFWGWDKIENITLLDKATFIFSNLITNND